MATDEIGVGMSFSSPSLLSFFFPFMLLYSQYSYRGFPNLPLYERKNQYKTTMLKEKK